MLRKTTKAHTKGTTANISQNIHILFTNQVLFTSEHRSDIVCVLSKFLDSWHVLHSMEPSSMLYPVPLHSPQRATMYMSLPANSLFLACAISNSFISILLAQSVRFRSEHTVTQKFWPIRANSIRFGRVVA